MVLVLECQCEESRRSPLVDEGRMQSGHWLWSVLYVLLSALTLLVG